jgi:hypothetical protein
MQTDTLFYVAWIALAVEIIWAINTARLAKQRTLPSTMVTPAAMAFATFHICWWMSEFKTSENIFAYVVGIFASIAFLFGTSFVSTGCMKLTDKGELCINKDNKVFQVVKNIPIKFDGRSLCSISWLAAVAIFFLPILMSAMAVVLAAVTAVVCLWTWQNPWQYYKEIINLEGWPETKVRRNKHGWWISPTPYIAGATFITIVGSSIYQHFSTVAMVIGVVLALYACTLLLVNLVIKQWAKTPEATKETIDPEIKESIEHLQYSPIKTLDIWLVFWQVFKQKFCPSIRYCDEDEMRHY